MKGRGLLVFLLLGAPGCSKASGASSEAAASSSAEGASSASAPARSPAGREDVARGADEVKPVYGTEPVAPDPRAERYCHAVHTLPAERRAACCEDRPRAPFERECVRTLSAALHAHAVSLDEGDLSQCEKAQRAALEGCGWVGIAPPKPAAACSGILRGAVGDGATCRSSLECKAGLTCYGLSATAPGHCVAPRQKDAICNTGTESLAMFSLQGRAVEREHPTCAGVCDKMRCKDELAIGASCRTSAECGRDKSCVEGHCAASPLPEEGARCASGECAAGLTCVDDHCAKLEAEGASCQSDRACFGACVGGTCQRKCKVATGLGLPPK